MNYFDEFEFKIPSQLRAIKSIETIVQSLEELSQSRDLTTITTRELSDRSGYALGTIFHHFKKFDDIFVYLFLMRRRKSLLKLVDVINKYPTEQPLSVLASITVNHFIHELSKPNRQALLFVMSHFLRRTKHPERFSIEGDLLISAWMNASQRDKTNTIYTFSENELRLRIRAVQAIIRSPFFENDPIAGTAEHKEIAFNLFMRLFIAPDLVEL